MSQKPRFLANDLLHFRLKNESEDIFSDRELLYKQLSRRKQGAARLTTALRIRVRRRAFAQAVALNFSLWHFCWIFGMFSRNYLLICNAEKNVKYFKSTINELPGRKAGALPAGLRPFCGAGFFRKQFQISGILVIQQFLFSKTGHGAPTLRQCPDTGHTPKRKRA